MPLCRRCHRTYHDLGVEWFDDELLDRAIEVENMRRKIFGIPDIQKEDIVRSDYWYKKHGLKRSCPLSGTKKLILGRGTLIKPGMEPLCGWPWLEANEGKVYPGQSIVVFFNNKELLAMPSTANKQHSVIKAAMKMAISIVKNRR